MVSISLQIFKFVGQKRLPNYKNPCWYDNLSGKTLLCVPYFFLLGVTKCGTSDVWQKLSFHPQIVRQVGKESHWWTQGRYGTYTYIYLVSVLCWCHISSRSIYFDRFPIFESQYRATLVLYRYFGNKRTVLTKRTIHTA